MIHILDGQKDTILDYVTIDNIIDDNHKKSLENTLETYDFITFADKQFSEFLEKRNRIIIPDEDDSLVEFVIFEAAKYKDTEGYKAQVYAHASYLELKKASILYPGSWTSTASQHGGRALNDTGWQIGIVEGKGTKTLTIENHTNPYAFLKRIAREFGLELRFRVTHNGNKIIGRYVDLLERVGMWQGREVEFGKDLDSIRRVEKQDIVTALLGIGPEDDEGNRVEVLVEDEDALKRWGRLDDNGELHHLIEPYEIQSSREEMTESEARQYTRTALNKRINTQITYETTIVDLEEVPGMENKKIRFGDTIKIKDTKFNPPLYLEARVFEQNRSIKSKAKKNIKLGDFIEHTEEEVNAIWKQLQKQIQNRVSKYEMYEYTYDKLTIDDKDETVFEDGKTFAEATGIEAKEHADFKASEAENSAKDYADTQDNALKADVEGYADGVADSALSQAKQYAVAKEVYENKVTEIVDDLAGRAPIEYVDGQIVSAIDEMEIGGRNLLKNSDFKQPFQSGSGGGVGDKWGHHRGSSSVDTSIGIVTIQDGAEISQIVFEEYGDYVLSVLAKGVELTVRTSGTPISIDNQPLTNSFQWYRISFSLNTGSLSRLIIGASGGVVEIDKIQLEKGNKAQDYRPAPEEYFSEIEKKADGDTVYTIEDVDNMINNTVSKTQYTTDMSDVVQDLSDQKTRIGQNATAIGLRAKTSELNAVEGSLETKIGDVEVKADAVEISVGEVRADLDGLEIGGRNLLKNSTFNGGLNSWSISIGTVLSPESDKPDSSILQLERTVSSDSNSPYYSLDRFYLDPKEGDTITFSFDYFCESADVAPNATIMTFRRFADPSSGSYVDSVVSWPASSMGVDGIYGKWVRATSTYTFSASKAVAGWYAFGVYSSVKAGKTDRHKYREIKVESGTKATDWTTAPEDIDARVETLDASITTLAGEVNLKASQSELNTLTDRVNTAESELQVLPGQIATKVDDGEARSIFQQEANSFTFDADQVNFTGHVFGQGATFKGALSAATGTFKGDLTAGMVTVGPESPNVGELNDGMQTFRLKMPIRTASNVYTWGNPVEFKLLNGDVNVTGGQFNFEQNVSTDYLSAFELYVSSKMTLKGDLDMKDEVIDAYGAIIRGGYVQTDAVDSPDHSGGNHVYIRPESGGELRATRKGTTSSYLPVRGSSHPTSSSVLTKTNREEFTLEEAYYLLDSAVIWKYHIQNNVDAGIFDKPKLGMLSETVPQQLRDEDGVDTYSIVSALWKIVQNQKKQIGLLKKDYNELIEII